MDDFICWFAKIALFYIGYKVLSYTRLRFVEMFSNNIEWFANSTFKFNDTTVNTWDSLKYVPKDNCKISLP